jgi:TolA-binding protein
VKLVTGHWSLVTLISVSLIGCSTSPKYHSAPSAAPVRKAIAVAQDSIAAAQHDVEDARHQIPDAVVTSISRHLFDAQSELRTANARITVLEETVQTQTNNWNQCEAEKAELKNKKSFNFLGLANIAIGFISNPFSFIITKLIELAAGILAIGLFVILGRAAWRRWRARRH